MCGCVCVCGGGGGGGGTTDEDLGVTQCYTSATHLNVKGNCPAQHRCYFSSNVCGRKPEKEVFNPRVG